MGTFDGPGLRLVVFLQGCNFRCRYCANPDTISLKTTGQWLEPDEILRRAISEKPFFGKRGGITFSGGEPTLQARALLPLFDQLSQHGIHICLDSNGSLVDDDARRLLQRSDMVLLDCKGFDPKKHQWLTQRTNHNPLQTALFLHDIGKPVRLRYVLIPGFSDQPQDLHALGQFFGPLKNIERIEVLPYHTYGRHKYEQLGIPYTLDQIKEPTPDQVAYAVDILQQYFNEVWTQ